MLGKSREIITTLLDRVEVRAAVAKWAGENGLRLVKSLDGVDRYRFGSPVLSNPIYIEIGFGDGQVTLSGWVQTVVPFVRWKLVHAAKPGIGTTADYRRKGGLFVTRLTGFLSASPHG